MAGPERLGEHAVRMLIVPQEFKGSLNAREATEAIARGLRRALPDAELDLLPLADGGPGTVEALVEATGGRFFEADAHDPLGRPLRARWCALGGRDTPTAAIILGALAKAKRKENAKECDENRSGE